VTHGTATEAATMDDERVVCMGPIAVLRFRSRWRIALPLMLLAVAMPAPALAQTECDDWQTLHPDWIFCDDFDEGTSLVRDGRYFEHDDDGGEFVVVDGVGLGGSHGMRTLWQAGEVGAGSLKLGFGRNPSGYMNRDIRPNEDFREVYYRMYLKMQEGWVGNPIKLSRATVIAASDWSQAMIAHVWEGSGEALGIDPVGCVGSDDGVVCVGYNDFAHMDWLGYQSGSTPIFSTGYDGRWYCVEARVRLNDPGLANGIQEFWIDGALEARAEQLDFVRSYTDYALNAIFFENYDNDGSAQEQERYFDNVVVATTRIGCLPPTGWIFSDGFESSDTKAWSTSVQ